MASIALGGTLKALKIERVKVQGELAKLGKAITVLEALVETKTVTPNGNHKRTLSAAARRKIGKAQKLRWAKVRKERAAKS
ncbi:MAG TPA: hypothetical protein VGP19_00330 [Candidatus Acidoferrales bacterium]|jgi:hypothetical protein|nr:hypothetical protein [Candidatus Acidoferrales bacterium]